MPDALRLAVGTLTAIRVPAPRRVDRSVARDAMLLAPLVGLLLGVLAAAVLTLVRVVAPDTRPVEAIDSLGAVLALATLALLTRGLHLDGLADTADGMGVKAAGAHAADRRLEVMRAPDVGAFGVATLVLVLLVQLAALTVCSLAGYGAVSLITAVVAGRLAATWCCTTPVAPARLEGLGAVVARSVPVPAALVATLLSLGAVAALGLLDDDGALRIGVALMASLLVGLTVAAVVLTRSTRRLGGVTGDVIGAAVELSTLTALTILATG
jgi:adenosylcobinamide-GDP ribazoletransferase